MIVAQFINKDEMMQSSVFQIKSDAFKVLLTDMESERTLPYISIYDNLDKAIVKAKHIVNYKEN